MMREDIEQNALKSDQEISSQVRDSKDGCISHELHLAISGNRYLKLFRSSSSRRPRCSCDFSYIARIKAGGGKHIRL